jgi:hypothetical protein
MTRHGLYPLIRPAGIYGRLALPARRLPIPVRMTNQAPFLSQCPKCGRECVMTGYAPDELGELLELGAEIEGYCGSCDFNWAISTEERADLASALSRPRKVR